MVEFSLDFKKGTQMSKFKEWMASATVAQKNYVADNGDTSLAMLYHISSGHKQASAAWAQRIVPLLNSFAGMPVVTVGDLVPTCAQCEYFKASCDGRGELI